MKRLRWAKSWLIMGPKAFVHVVEMSCALATSENQIKKEDSMYVEVHTGHMACIGACVLW